MQEQTRRVDDDDLKYSESIDTRTTDMSTQWHDVASPHAWAVQSTSEAYSERLGTLVGKEWYRAQRSSKAWIIPSLETR